MSSTRILQWSVGSERHAIVHAYSGAYAGAARDMDVSHGLMAYEIALAVRRWVIRHEVGVWPDHRRKARVKALASEKSRVAAT